MGKVLLYFVLCFGVACGQFGFFPRNEGRFRVPRPRPQLPSVGRLLTHLSNLNPFNGPRQYDQYGITYYDNNYNTNYVSFPDTNPNYNVVNGVYTDNNNDGKPNIESQTYPDLIMEIEKRPSFDDEPPIEMVYIDPPIKMPKEIPTELPRTEYTIRPIVVIDDGRNTGSKVESDDKETTDDSREKDGFVMWPMEKETENHEVTTTSEDLQAVPASSPEALPMLTPAPPRNNIYFGSEVQYTATCRALDGGDGSCLLVTLCPPMLALLKQVQSGMLRSDDVRANLQKIHCGFQDNYPKVCCPLADIATSSRPNTIPTVLPTAPPTPAPTTTTTTTTTEAPSSRQPRLEDDVFPEPPTCGVSNASNFRVVGGQNASLGDFPWLAVLGYRRRSDTRWQCGGVLVSARHVLTAAHCVMDNLYVVRLGELDLSRDDDGASPVDYLVTKKIAHEGYSRNNYANDVGILVLDRSVTFTNMIHPICLPQNTELRARSFENYTPFVAGWGYLNFTGPSSDRLQYVQLPVTSQEACAQAYRSYKSQVIDRRVICAGFPNGGKDACKGDSGGPLMQPVWNPVTSRTYVYAIGVVSYGKGCAEKNAPGVYSRVGEFMPWITSTMLANS